jgi:hypothetical protein
MNSSCCRASRAGWRELSSDQIEAPQSRFDDLYTVVAVFDLLAATGRRDGKPSTITSPTWRRGGIASVGIGRWWSTFRTLLMID